LREGAAADRAPLRLFAFARTHVDEGVQDGYEAGYKN
jgi:hypothetical protein